MSALCVPKIRFCNNGRGTDEMLHIEQFWGLAKTKARSDSLSQFNIHLTPRAANSTDFLIVSSILDLGCKTGNESLSRHGPQTPATSCCWGESYPCLQPCKH